MIIQYQTKPQKNCHFLQNVLKKTNDVGISKKRIKGQLLQLMEGVDGCFSQSALKQLEKQLTAATNLFISLKKEQGVIPLTKENVNVPANKNMEVQRRFYTTKKKHKKTKICLSKPSNVYK